MLVLVAVGCRGGDDRALMPLKEGRAWTYKFRLKGIDSVGTLKVVRSLSISNTVGYELSSPEGLSRLVWKGKELLMANGTQGRLTPPMPILSLTMDEIKWHGQLETIGKVAPASATIRRLKSEDGKRDTRKLEYRGRKIECAVSVVEIEIPKRSVILETWFAPGIGIVKQVQRTNEQQDVMIELLREN